MGDYGFEGAGEFGGMDTNFNCLPDDVRRQTRNVIESPTIDYGLVQRAIDFYERRGFEYVETPWTVSAAALEVTCPKDAESNDSVVASGEQGFLELWIQQRKLLPGRAYCTATPCFRPYDSQRTSHHYGQFFKIELIALYSPDYDLSSCGERLVRSEMKHAREFMERYRNDLMIVDTQDEPRKGCKTYYSCDIETVDGVEMGSYGIRSTTKLDKQLDWFYGTGLALPRFHAPFTRIS